MGYKGALVLLILPVTEPVFPQVKRGGTVDDIKWAPCCTGLAVILLYITPLSGPQFPHLKNERTDLNDC